MKPTPLVTIKDMFKLATVLAGIPYDVSRPLKSQEWRELYADRESFPVNVLKASLSKTSPEYRFPPKHRRGTAEYMRYAYETALRQGFGTRPQRGALLSDELGI